MSCDGQVFYGSGISYSWALPEIKPFDFELFSYSAVYHSTLLVFFELWFGTPKLLPLSVSTNIKEWLPNENQGRGTYNELLKEKSSVAQANNYDIKKYEKSQLTFQKNKNIF